jgi:hypothetical protein
VVGIIWNECKQQGCQQRLCGLLGSHTVRFYGTKLSIKISVSELYIKISVFKLSIKIGISKLSIKIGIPSK